MIFDSLKVLHVCNDRGLTIEELFILQTVYDYQVSVKDLDRQNSKLLQSNYIKYFETFAEYYDKGGEFQRPSGFKNMVDKLIRDEWLEDYRKDKDEFHLSELLVSDKFINSFKGKETDEELFEQFKAAYPYFYKSQYNTILENFNYQDSEELFKKFKKIVLSGNRKQKWAEFIVITRGVFEENRETPSKQRIDRYLENFYDNIELYRREAEAYYNRR